MISSKGIYTPHRFHCFSKYNILMGYEPFIMVGGSSVWEEHNCPVLQNVGHPSMRPYGVITQETIIRIFTAVKATNLIKM